VGDVGEGDSVEGLGEEHLEVLVDEVVQEVLISCDHVIICVNFTFPLTSSPLFIMGSLTWMVMLKICLIY